MNDFQPLTVITKNSTLDVAAVLDPPLVLVLRGVRSKVKSYGRRVTGVAWKPVKANHIMRKKPTRYAFLIALLCKIVHSAPHINWKYNHMKSVLSFKCNVAIVTNFWRCFIVAKATSNNIVNETSWICYLNNLKIDVVIATFFNTVSASLCLLGSVSWTACWFQFMFAC